MSQTQVQSILIKICFEDQIRLLRVAEPAKLKKLLKSSCALFGLSKQSVSISFKDQEGDQIVVSSDIELQLAVKGSQGTPKLFLRLQKEQNVQSDSSFVDDSSAVATEEEQKECSTDSSSASEKIDEGELKTKQQQPQEGKSSSSTFTRKVQIRALKLKAREVKKSRREEVQKLKLQISCSKEEIQRVKHEKKKQIGEIKAQISDLKEEKKLAKSEKKWSKKRPEAKGEDGKMKRKEQMEAFSQQLARIEAAGFTKRGRNFALLKKFNGDEVLVLQHLAQKMQKKDEDVKGGRQEKRREKKEKK
eukprot:TRINITY_DN344_c0_g2_i1.p1 TRINITY_DN344_c0_g2~~TRINITY_DN344_c0_g2_i1.p1  ORF type:complete len:329 (-),score=135.83 TRINITY_DN344_c0_g2_i1:95-1006(-)